MIRLSPQANVLYFLSVASFLGQRALAYSWFVEPHRRSSARCTSRYATIGGTEQSDDSDAVFSPRRRPQPIDPAGWPMKFPAKEHCSKCGLCETTFVEHVKEACAFLDNGMRGIDALEPLVHNGRSRNLNDQDELRFGVLHQPIQLVRGINQPGSQWTGAVTSIAVSLLETKQVDAVICVANGSNDEGVTIKSENDGWCTPAPIIARTVEEVLRGRGVKPALAPSLRVLDKIQSDPSIRRLLFCGVGCAVQAFRAVQDKLTHVEEVYVLGTNCADNAPTPKAANNFIQAGMGIPTSGNKQVRGYEFMQDYRVHVKLEDPVSKESDYVTKPYFCLPGSVADPSIAYSCRACFDYTNALADVVVGYMGAPITSPNMRMDDVQNSQQTLTIRNKRGWKMVQTAIQQERLWINPKDPLDKGKHQGTAVNTVLSDSLVQKLYVDNFEPSPSGMPGWLGNIAANVLFSIGPKGLAFARYSIDYHILRNFFHVLHQCQGDDTQTFQKLPKPAVQVVQEYLKSSNQMRDLMDQIKGQFDRHNDGRAETQAPGI
ncbi:hypothetical protein ACA910_005830 [Epithemia clementina (nom. ined.)]